VSSARRWWRHRATIAVAAAGVAIGGHWLVHLAEPEAPFAPFSLANWIIRRAPPGLATTAIEQLGHNALRVLAAATIVAAFGLALLLRHVRAPWLVGVAAVLTVGAAALDPVPRTTTWTAAAATVAAGAVFAVHVLATPAETPTPTGAVLRRRQFLAGASLLVAAGVLGTQAIRRVARQVTAAVVRADRGAQVPRDAAFSNIADLSLVVTPRRDHYTVDINLDDPIVHETSWRLRIRGAASRQVELSLAELRAMPTLERLAALACISNPVGGDLVGNSRWTGVPVRDLLRLVGPHPDARFLEARGADGYAETLPLAAVQGDDALVAFAMNGALLPHGHGFPARLRVPSRYGVKNVKWLTELVILDQDKRGYWGARGWDHNAIVHTQSRIDTPQHGDLVGERFTIAGIAWAGDRRIARVEVSTNDGATWQEAQLEQQADPLSWRRWQTDLRLGPGDHPLVVRAVDGHGDRQPPDRAPPHPSGATGWHRIVVTVSDLVS
jgi:DMSO/TMAO reductase YedYZ molybdopterin-dependent catalytic subunit